MKRRTWLVKYDPKQCAGYEPGRRGEDMWPMPGVTEPVVWNDPPRRDDRLIWQTIRPGDRKRLVGIGRVAASRLVWLERGEYATRPRTASTRFTGPAGGSGPTCGSGCQRLGRPLSLRVTGSV